MIVRVGTMRARAMIPGAYLMKISAAGALEITHRRGLPPPCSSFGEGNDGRRRTTDLSPLSQQSSAGREKIQ